MQIPVKPAAAAPGRFVAPKPTLGVAKQPFAQVVRPPLPKAAALAPPPPMKSAPKEEHVRVERRAHREKEEHHDEKRHDRPPLDALDPTNRNPALVAPP